MISKLFRSLMLLYSFIYCYIWSIECKRSSIIYFTSRVRSFNNGKVIIGYNSSIGRRRKAPILGFFIPTNIYSIGKNTKIKIGNNTCLNGVSIMAKAYVEIGNNCRIASGTIIIDSNGHEVYSLDRTKDKDRALPILIGNNVWIGLNSIILKGSTIGDNSIVAANSVVKGKFPSNVVLQGNPARIIKYLDLENNG